MKRIFKSLIVLLILVQNYSCSRIKSVNTYSVIRNNHFNSRSFDLPVIDTNKFDSRILQKIFDRVNLVNDADYLLIEHVLGQLMYKNLVFYDYHNNNYFALFNDDRNSSFKKIQDTTNEEITAVRYIKSLGEEILNQKAKQPPTVEKNDFGYFIVNKMKISEKKIYINAYYIKDL